MDNVTNNPPNNTLRNVIIAVVVIIVILLAWVFLGGKNMPNFGQQNNQQQNTQSQNYSDNAVSFQYPHTLGTTYIEPIDWPPKAQVVKEKFTCTTAGSETEQAGKTQPLTINGHNYCVTKFTQGAAGSLYSLYAYGFEKDGKTVILSFGLRFPQCDNYEGDKKAACKAEENSFDVNGMVDTMASTVQLK